MIERIWRAGATARHCSGSPPRTPRGSKRKYRKGDIGFHHYAFELSSRKDVDTTRRLSQKNGMTVVDPPGVLRPQLLRCLFRRSGRHEARRASFGRRRRRQRKPRSRGAKRKKEDVKTPPSSGTLRSVRRVRTWALVLRPRRLGIERGVGRLDQMGRRLRSSGTTDYDADADRDMAAQGEFSVIDSRSLADRLARLLGNSVVRVQVKAGQQQGKLFAAITGTSMPRPGLPVIVFRRPNAGRYRPQHDHSGH